MSLLVAAVAFVVMEPVTYAAHRWVMHGVGERLHRSHHQPPTGRFEANDWYPVMFAAVVLAGLAVGFNVPGWGGLVPVGVGITLYGMAYAFVHDGYIHRRLPFLGEWRSPLLDRLAEAHRIHHLYNGEPYGMLVPFVPADLRARATRTDRNPLDRGAAALRSSSH